MYVRNVRLHNTLTPGTRFRLRPLLGKPKHLHARKRNACFRICFNRCVRATHVLLNIRMHGSIWQTQCPNLLPSFAACMHLQLLHTEQTDQPNQLTIQQKHVCAMWVWDRINLSTPSEADPSPYAAAVRHLSAAASCRSFCALRASQLRPSRLTMEWSAFAYVDMLTSCRMANGNRQNSHRHRIIHVCVVIVEKSLEVCRRRPLKVVFSLHVVHKCMSLCTIQHMHMVCVSYIYANMRIHSRCVS